MKNHPAICRDGWTLIELIAVLSLLALLCGGAFFTLRSPLREGRWQSELDAILTADRLARAEARSTGKPITLCFHWGTSPSLEVRGTRSQKKSEKGRIVRAASLQEARSAGDRKAQQELILKIDGRGASPTYALKFLSPKDGELWVVVAGLSGQPIFRCTRSQVHEFLAAAKQDVP